MLSNRFPQVINNRELVIDYNYRFPKFMEINYPNSPKETNNEEGQL